MLDSCGDLRYRRGAHRRRIRAGFLRKVTFDNMPGTGPLGYPALLSSPSFTNVVEMRNLFDDGKHWVPVYRARFQGAVPPLQMRICTKFKPGNSDVPSDMRSYSTSPFKFVAKLVSLLRELQCCFIDEPWRGAQQFVQP